MPQNGCSPACQGSHHAVTCVPPPIVIPSVIGQVSEPQNGGW